MLQPCGDCRSPSKPGGQARRAQRPEDHHPALLTASSATRGTVRIAGIDLATPRRGQTPDCLLSRRNPAFLTTSPSGNTSCSWPASTRWRISPRAHKAPRRAGNGGQEGSPPGIVAGMKQKTRIAVASTPRASSSSMNRSPASIRRHPPHEGHDATPRPEARPSSQFASAEPLEEVWPTCSS